MFRPVGKANYRNIGLRKGRRGRGKGIFMIGRLGNWSKRDAPENDYEVKSWLLSRAENKDTCPRTAFSKRKGIRGQDKE
jgi:hypothetical protein